MPRFSIVIPSRNRARFLRYALASAVRQEFDDYEIIVGDNCSSDDTPSVVHTLADSRVRYYRSDTSLHVTASWEFAQSKASGDYIVLLLDDNVALPSLLSTAARVIDEQHPTVLNFPNSLSYTIEPSQPGDQINSLVLAYPPTRSVELVDSCEQLRLIFSFRQNQIERRLTRGTLFYSREAVERIRGQAGAFFLPPWPDYAAHVALLATVPRFVNYDIPVMVIGSGTQSSGSAWLRDGKESRAIVNEYDEAGLRLHEHVPLRNLAASNLAAESWLRAKAALPDELHSVDLDWESYFVLCFEDLQNLEAYGANVLREMNEFFSILVQQPAPLQARIKQRIRPRLSARSRAWRKLRSRLGPWKQRARGLVAAAQHAKSRSERAWPRVIHGDAVGFASIFEAASWFDKALD